jgi:hypothetical protein
MSSEPSEPRAVEPAVRDLEREARRLQRLRRFRLVELRPAENRIPSNHFDPGPKEAA